MDINQAARMIEWLDEERRRDKSLIATLEERLAQQQQLIENFQRRMNSLESEQTVMQGSMVTSEREGELKELIRREMRQLLESTEAKRLTAEREADRRHELQLQTLTRSLAEQEEKVSRYEKQATSIADLNAERERMMTIVNSLQQRVEDLVKLQEEPDRRLAFLEEQRRQDARRISESETEVPDLRKSIDSVRTKTALIEELALRNERRVQEVFNSESERRDQIQAFIDQQTLLLQQRDQQISDLVKRFGENDDAMQRNLERFETWSEAYRNMKRIIDDFERIGDRLERRINEVAEMQRLSEERFRQEWNDWQADDQKRWKQYTLSTDEIWRNHDKEFDRYVQRVVDIDEAIRPLEDSLARLWKLERERAQLYRERYQAMLLEYDTVKPTTSATSTSTGTLPAVHNGPAPSDDT